MSVFLGFVLGYVEYRILTGFEIYKKVMFQLQLVSALALIYFAKWQYEFKRREHLDPRFEVEDLSLFHGWEMSNNSNNEREREINEVNLMGNLENKGPGNARDVILESLKLNVAASGEDWGSTGLTDALEVDKEISLRMKEGEPKSLVVDISDLVIGYGKSLIEVIEGDEKLEILGAELTVVSNKGRQKISVEDIGVGGLGEEIYDEDVNVIGAIGKNSGPDGI